jgi:hypothetical protein
VDLAGPPVVDLIGGGCYILIIVDNFSKYYHVEILKAKSEAAKAIKFFVTKMETQHLRNLKRPRSENGGESISKDLLSWSHECRKSACDDGSSTCGSNLNHKAGSKVEAKWKQSGSKSIEHARRNGFATEALMPLGGNLRDFCHWVANLRDYCHQ